MSKNIYIVLVVVVVLGLAFWVFNLPKSEKTSETHPAKVQTQSITNVTSPASAVLAGAKNINWQTNNYPARAGVNINLVRKISDSPREFTLVRILNTDTSNDGQEVWFPQAGEKTNDLYIEVTCSNSYQFKTGCSLITSPMKVS